MKVKHRKRPSVRTDVDSNGRWQHSQPGRAKDDSQGAGPFFIFIVHIGGTTINSYACLALCKSRGLKEGNKAKHGAVICAVLCEQGNRTPHTPYTYTVACVNYPQMGT